MKRSKQYTILLLFFLFSCSKNDSSVIPYVPVNILIYASDPSFTNLNPIGGWIYLQGGSRGILIFRKSSDEFLAYDRHCTYQPENSCAKIMVDPNNNFLAIDTCCKSKFYLMDGSVNQGPATIPLKKYNTSFDGNRLNIYN
jgi:hypothetical protein